MQVTVLSEIDSATILSPFTFLTDLPEMVNIVFAATNGRKLESLQNMGLALNLQLYGCPY